MLLFYEGKRKQNLKTKSMKQVVCIILGYSGECGKQEEEMQGRLDINNLHIAHLRLQE